MAQFKPDLVKGVARCAYSYYVTHYLIHIDVVLH
jgi:hypothetical protein